MRMAQLSHLFPIIWLHIPLLARELKVLDSISQEAKKLMQVFA